MRSRYQVYRPWNTKAQLTNTTYPDFSTFASTHVHRIFTHTFPERAWSIVSILFINAYTDVYVCMYVRLFSDTPRRQRWPPHKNPMTLCVFRHSSFTSLSLSLPPPLPPPQKKVPPSPFHPTAFQRAVAMAALHWFMYFGGWNREE